MCLCECASTAACVSDRISSVCQKNIYIIIPFRLLDFNFSRKVHGVKLPVSDGTEREPIEKRQKEGGHDGMEGELLYYVRALVLF